MARKSEDERIAEIEAGIAQEKARLSKLRAQKLDKERKAFDHKARIAGKLVLEHGDADSLKALADKHLTKPEERRLFGLE